MVIPKKILSGQDAEQQACVFLQSKGLILLTRNFHCRLGEIDLIMQDRDDIVFIEVRMRNNLTCGSAIESVDQYKQAKIIKAATFFLDQKNYLNEVNCRFDVIGINYSPTNKASFEWIKDAFSSDYC